MHGLEGDSHGYGPEDEIEEAFDNGEDGWDEEGGDDVELALADDEERLPWLESGEYDDDEEGFDGARIFGLFLMGLLAVAVLIGAIWYFTHRGPDPELAADGSTIAAPQGDYKEKPADPGGKTFEGTGDTSFAVGEGQTREGRIAEGGDSAPKPSVDTQGQTQGKAQGQEDTTTAGVPVQVGAFSSRESAVSGWGKLNRQTDKLQGVKYRVVEGQADIGKVYRLQAIAGNAADAKRLCAALEGDGVPCQVKK